jgi:alcohol dehydrogenase class IV
MKYFNHFEMLTKLYVGENTFIESMPKLLSSFKGNRILYFTGSRGRMTIPDFNGRETLTEEVFMVKGEPTVAMVDRALRVCERFRPDIIVSIGGGSVIDSAKAVSFLAGAENDLFYCFDHPNYMEKTIPHIAVPTTCGTGAEVTANAVIRRDDRKQSLRSDSLRPYAAIIDPAFTIQLPLEVLVFSSLDSLTQLIEAFVSNNSNPITDGFCREGLRLFQKGFQLERLSSLTTEERLSLQLAALYSGIALSNSGLGIVHGVASIIGGRSSVTHGEICARFVRPFTETNIYKARKEDKQTLNKYQEIARILGDHPKLSPDDLPVILKSYESALEGLTLSILPFLEQEGEAIANESLQASSTQGNPFTYTKEEILEVIDSVH